MASLPSPSPSPSPSPVEKDAEEGSASNLPSDDDRIEPESLLLQQGPPSPRRRHKHKREISIDDVLVAELDELGEEFENAFVDHVPQPRVRSNHSLHSLHSATARSSTPIPGGRMDAVLEQVDSEGDITVRTRPGGQEHITRPGGQEHINIKPSTSTSTASRPMHWRLKTTDDGIDMKTVRRIQKAKSDRYFDYFETHKQVLALSGLQSMHSTSSVHSMASLDDVEIEIPSLHECQLALHNEEADAHRRKVDKQSHVATNVLLDALAATYIYITNSMRYETLLVVINASLSTFFYCKFSDTFAVKLDFSFLAFSVVFPLSFLIQSTFNRRELALQRLADFKSALLTAALLSLTVDWDSEDSGSNNKGSDGRPKHGGGRLALPENFAAALATDFRDIVQLVYEYLSMPSVSHARNILFPKKRLATMRVHALQNNIIKRFNDAMFDLYMNTEEMKIAGFPSGEASRLHQYHQFIQQRFELLRIVKYYRTPQATRSFGRVYIYVLPWLTGPYFAWVFSSTDDNYAYVLCLAAFTYLVLLGLLNTQASLEDPFLPDYTSWTPGIDTVKLDFEMANALQAIDQYYAQAELRRVWTEKKGSHQETS